MTFFNTVKRWLSLACINYTIIALFLILLNLLGEGSSHISAMQFLRILPVGLCIALGTMLSAWKRCPRWASALSHYALTVLSIFICLYLPTSSSNAASKMLMFVLLSVIYWVIVGAYVLIRSRVRKLMEED